MRGAGRRVPAFAVVATLLAACAGGGGAAAPATDGADDNGDGASETGIEAATGDDADGDVPDDDPGSDAGEDAGESEPGEDQTEPQGEADEQDDEQDDEQAGEQDTTPVEVDLTMDPADDCATLAGFDEADPAVLTDALLAELPEPGGAMRGDADLGPLTKAILLVEANEGVLPRTRYRLRYGVEHREVPPAADPVEVGILRIDRFNLGPTIRDGLVEQLGEDAVGPAEDFGTGPHVSYCLQLRSLQGVTADVFDAARAEYPDTAVDDGCFGQHCLTEGSVPEAAIPWEGEQQLGIRLVPEYDPLRDGVPSPAAAIDLALIQAGVSDEDGGWVQWNGFEYREGLAPGEPFVEVVVESGLGQDGSLDLAMREGHIMDHTMEAAWQRISAVASDIPEDPSVWHATAVEERSAG